MIKTKNGKQISWTLKSPATPEMIEAYAKGFDYESADEIEKAARDSAAEYVKREIAALDKLTNGEASNTKTIDDISNEIIAHREGFLVGARFVLAKLEANLHRR